MTVRVEHVIEPTTLMEDYVWIGEVLGVVCLVRFTLSLLAIQNHLAAAMNGKTI